MLVRALPGERPGLGEIAPDALNIPSVLAEGPTPDIRVVVTPAAVRLAPGASATYRIHVYGAGAKPLDQGSVTRLGADGATARIPVVIAR
jgi:hypothetical protein